MKPFCGCKRDVMIDVFGKECFEGEEAFLERNDCFLNRDQLGVNARGRREETKLENFHA
jgi:hypothetical protein